MQYRSCLLLALLIVAAPASAGQDRFIREGAALHRRLVDALECQAPPPLRVSDWINTNGRVITLEALKGKVVLLDFCAAWSLPCRQAIPKIAALREKYAKAGLVILSIHTTRKAEALAGFAAETGITWPAAADIENRTVQAYHVDSWPDYYLIDRAGELRMADLALSGLESAVAALLAETPPSAVAGGGP